MKKIGNDGGVIRKEHLFKSGNTIVLAHDNVAEKLKENNREILDD